MAVLGFHFSGVYKKPLFNGTKKATIMNGENCFRLGQEILVYVSDKSNLFEGRIEERIGKAIIEKVEIKKVRDLSDLEAKLCGSKKLQELKDTLKKWYDSDENSTVTYIKFSLKLEGQTGSKPH